MGPGISAIAHVNRFCSNLNVLVHQGVRLSLRADVPVAGFPFLTGYIELTKIDPTALELHLLQFIPSRIAQFRLCCLQIGLKQSQFLITFENSGPRTSNSALLQGNIVTRSLVK